MSAAYASETTRIREMGHLSADDIARATGATATTVRSWTRGSRSPSETHAERLLELSTMVERLVQVIEPTYVPLWLRKPIPLLDLEKPLDLIASGEYRKVAGVIAGLESPPAI